MIDVFLDLYINLHFVRLHIKKIIKSFPILCKRKKEMYFAGTEFCPDDVLL